MVAIEYKHKYLDIEHQPQVYYEYILTKTIKIPVTDNLN